MVTPEGEHGTGHGFVCQGNVFVDMAFVEHFIQRRGLLHTEIKPNAVHVLGI
jgi:hypothetical protein